jgi:exosome complex RNA-binding protein Rrp42 (RNase PH superfamily)
MNLFPVTKKNNPSFRGMASKAQLEEHPNLVEIDLIALASVMAMKQVEVPVIEVKEDDVKVTTDPVDPAKVKRKP